MKIVFNAVAPDRRLLSPLARFSEFTNFSFNQVALENADVTDIESTVEMIGFVKKGAREQILASHLEPLASYILRLHGNFLSARDLLAEARNA